MCQTEKHIKHIAFNINRNQPYYDSYIMLRHWIRNMHIIVTHAHAYLIFSNWMEIFWKIRVCAQHTMWFSVKCQMPKICRLVLDKFSHHLKGAHLKLALYAPSGPDVLMYIHPTISNPQDGRTAFICWHSISQFSEMSTEWTIKALWTKCITAKSHLETYRQCCRCICHQPPRIC